MFQGGLLVLVPARKRLLNLSKEHLSAGQGFFNSDQGAWLPWLTERLACCWQQR